MGYKELKWVVTKKILVITLCVGIITLSVIKFLTYKEYKVISENNKKEVKIDNKKELVICNDESDVIKENDEKANRNLKEEPATKVVQDNNDKSKETIKVNKSGTYKDIFKNDLFIGDSITKGLIGYNFLPSENVCAKIGIGSDKLKTYLNNADKENPENIFLLCGINDLDGNIERENFRKNYSNLLKATKTKFPNAKIYVQSILPLTDKGEQKPPYVKNWHINEYNKIIKEIASSQNITYLNIAEVIKSNSIYDGDGMHFKSTFYPLWLKYLIDNVK